MHSKISAQVSDVSSVRAHINSSEIWVEGFLIPETPDFTTLTDSSIDTSGVVKVFVNRSLGPKTGTNSYEIADEPGLLTNVVLNEDISDITLNLSGLNETVPIAPTGYNPVIVDSQGTSWPMSIGTWYVDDHKKEIIFNRSIYLNGPLFITFAKYIGKVGIQNTSIVPRYNSTIAATSAPTVDFLNRMTICNDGGATPIDVTLDTNLAIYEDFASMYILNLGSSPVTIKITDPSLATIMSYTTYEILPGAKVTVTYLSATTAGQAIPMFVVN